MTSKQESVFNTILSVAAIIISLIAIIINLVVMNRASKFESEYYDLHGPQFLVTSYSTTGCSENVPLAEK